MEDKEKSSLSLNKCKFVHGTGMQRMWVKSNVIFLNWAVAKYRQSIKASLLAGEVVVTKIDEDIIPKFDTKEDETKHLATLKYWEQKLYHSTLEDYTKYS